MSSKRYAHDIIDDATDELAGISNCLEWLSLADSHGTEIPFSEGVAFLSDSLKGIILELEDAQEIAFDSEYHGKRGEHDAAVLELLGVAKEQQELRHGEAVEDGQ